MDVLLTSFTVKHLGVILDSNLSFENHISHVTKTAFFHLRNIAKLRNMLTVSDEEKLVHAFMTSRLDYCNALLGGCPASSINKLQIVQMLRLESLPGQENMKSSFPKRYKSILIVFMKMTFFYLDPYILLIFNLSC